MCLGSITTRLVAAAGEEIDDEEEEEGDCWSDSVTGADNCIYGIPASARRVVKFNPVDNSMTEIGPDLGEGECKWICGVVAGNGSGSIYCMPYSPSSTNSILKIDTINGNVTLLDVEFPETGDWSSGALAIDNCIYFMPSDACRILKLDPDNDTVSSVGSDLPGEMHGKYSGTVAGNDNCLYGIPYNSNRIVRFDPISQAISFVGGREMEDHFMCGTGALGRGGYIYAESNQFPAAILKIDVVKNTYSFTRITVPYEDYEFGWAGAILGCDWCIYFPPHDANQVLKFDTDTNVTSLVGDDFGDEEGKWNSGAAAVLSGVIYCMPHSGASQVLAIHVDPFREFKMTLQANTEHHPEDLGLGSLFKKNEHGKTAYECGVVNFGKERVFRAIEDCIPLNAECEGSINLPPFIVAASYENSAVAVVYFLLRRNLDAFSAICFKDGNKSQTNNNRKRKMVD